MSYKPVDLHAKKAQALVVHCADPRFQAAYRQIIDQLGLYYDLLVFPGASKAIAGSQLVVDNIKLLHGFHNFEKIHVIDHIECGAFGQIDDEVESHSQFLKKARAILAKELPGVEFNCHLLGEESELQLSLNS